MGREQGAVAAVGGRDDGLAGRHGFRHHDPEAFSIRGGGAGDVAGGIQTRRLGVREPPNEGHVRQGVAQDVAAQGRLLAPRPGDQQADRKAIPAKPPIGAQEHHHALAWFQPSDEQQRYLGAGVRDHRAFVGETPKVGAGRRDLHDLARARPQVGAGSLRNGDGLFHTRQEHSAHGREHRLAEGASEGVRRRVMKCDDPRRRAAGERLHREKRAPQCVVVHDVERPRPHRRPQPPVLVPPGQACFEPGAGEPHGVRPSQPQHPDIGRHRAPGGAGRELRRQDGDAMPQFAQGRRSIPDVGLNPARPVQVVRTYLGDLQ